MKRTLFDITTAAMLLAALLMGCAAFAAESAGAAGYLPAKRMAAYISQAKAKTIALEHAGLTAKDVKFVRTKLDRDDSEYEIEFYTADKEYDYEIDAVSGAVLGCDFDAEHYTPKTAKLTQAQAKQAALKHAGLAEKDVTFTKVKQDRENKTLEYDIEFYTDTDEYEYEIDAQTGEVLDFDRDTNDRRPKSAVSSTTSAITSDKAKQTALAHANVDESKTTRMKVKKDRDDGRTVYEVEFNVGRSEYSYKIDAATGKILEFEIDEDD